MRGLFSRTATTLIFAGLLVAIVPRASAETQTENVVAEQRTYVYLQVAPGKAQAFLPSGWKVNPAAAGATKDSNLTILFLDRKLALTPDGKPLQSGTNRLLVVIVQSNLPNCQPLCPQWISAEGQITERTPALFKKALAKAGKLALPIVISMNRPTSSSASQ